MPISTRSYFEGKGYKVEYDPKSKNIRVYDPKSGSSAMIGSSSYKNVGGTSTITSDVAKKIEETLASGKYNVYESGVKTKPSSGGSQSTQSQLNKAKEQYSGQITPEMIGGHDPNWFLKLSPEVQELVQAERARVGLAPLPTDRPLTYQESIAKGMPGFESLSPEVQQRIAQGEYATFEGYPSPVIYQPEEVPVIQQLEPIIEELQYLVREAYQSPEIGPMLSRAYEQTLATIDQAQSQLMAQMEKQMGGVDPATMAALTALREEVQRQRQSLMEEMSKRGLLQSGIWLEMEDRLNRGQLTAEQQMLAQRLSDIQNQINQALMSFGQMKTSAAQQFGMEGLRQVESQAQRRQQALQEGLNKAVELYKFSKELPLREWETYAPYYTMTARDWAQLPLDWTKEIGEVPPYAGQEGYLQAGAPSNDLIAVRDYFPSAGWDSKTKEVIINGQRIKPDQIINDRAYISKDKLARLLGVM